MTDESDTTHFGFKTVRAEDKAGLVRQVFDSVAPKYDLMNDLMSGGVHRLWKNALIDWLDPRPGQHLLDVGGGTGDVAFKFLDRAARHGQGADVTVCDINKQMLAVGRDGAVDKGLLHGDAEHLPIPDMSQDAYTIAFCLRNVTDIDQAMRDARRVLKPGGRFLCLEFSHVILPLLKEAYDVYSFKVLPWMGEVVAKDRESYLYLAESIRRFPPQKELARRMSDAGLANVSFRNLSGGIAALHSAWRI